MERIPGFTPRRVAAPARAEDYMSQRVEVHYFGCGTHREVLAPGDRSSVFCPKCGPGDLSYDGWGERLRPSFRSDWTTPEARR